MRSTITYVSSEDEADDSDNDGFLSIRERTKSQYRDVEATATATANNRRPRLHGGVEVSYSPSSEDLESLNDDDDRYERDSVELKRRHKLRKMFQSGKIFVLIVFWCIFTYYLLVRHEIDPNEFKILCVTASDSKSIELEEQVETKGHHVGIIIYGPFPVQANDGIMFMLANDKENSSELYVSVEEVFRDAQGVVTKTNVISDAWTLKLVSPENFDAAEALQRVHLFAMNTDAIAKQTATESSKFQVRITTNVETTVPLEIYCDKTPFSVPFGIITSFLLVAGLYFLLIFDCVHRTMAVVVFCSLSMGMLALMNARPELHTIISWIDFQLMLLLFGLTILIATFSETGILDYLAVVSYELCNGHVWPLVNSMCLITVLASMVFDNIIILTIVTPVTLRLMEVMELNPIPVLICLMISSNVAAGVTPTGEEPNNAISNNKYVNNVAGTDTFLYILHILPGTLLALLQTYIHMRIMYHNSNSMRYKSPMEVERLRRVIKVWSHTARSINAYSKDEKQMQDSVKMKVRRLRQRLRRIGRMPRPAMDYKDKLESLKEMYPIKNRPLLIKCLIALAFAIILFLLAEFHLHHLTIGWVALLACLMLLIITDVENIESVLEHIEWATLLYFAASNVFMRALITMGLFDYIARSTKEIIESSSVDSRLIVAMLSVLWITAISSIFLDSAFVGLTMLRAILTMIEAEDLKLPLQPLLWALSLGSCFGSNGTLVSSISNVVCAGIAERHEYNFPFMDYFKVGFPIMIGNVIMSTIYLLIVHVVFTWH